MKIHNNNTKDEKNLHKKELFELYHFFFHHSKEAFIITNECLEIIQINQAACVMLNIDCNNSVGHSLYEQLYFMSNAYLQRQLKQLRENSEHEDIWILPEEDGEIRQISYTAQFDGNHYTFTLNDVTGINKNEYAYSISAQMFNDLFTEVTDGVIVFDRHGLIIDVNKTFLMKVEMTKQDLIGEKLSRFLTEKARNEWINEWEIVKNIGKVSGTIEWIDNEKRLFFDITLYRNLYNNQYIAVYKDITEKMLIQLQLKESKEIFSYIFEQANDAFVLVNKRGYVIEVNEVAQRLFGINREQFVGRLLEEFISPKNETYYSIVRRFLIDRVVRGELFYKMPDGELKLLEFTSKQIRGTYTSVVVLRNVSDRYEMEQKLKKSEKKFRRIFEGMTDGLILWKGDNIIDVNESGAKIFDYPRKKIKLMKVQDIVEILDNGENTIQNMVRKIKQMNDVEEVVSIEVNGKIKHVELITKKNLVSGMHLTVIKDVTEKLELQERLRKSDTLNVVGELAAGIAHEIRNPMTALKGFIQLLQSSIKEDYSSYFSIITSELRRIDTIITEFLVLAKPQAVKYKEKDINVILSETIELLNAESLLNNSLLSPKLSEKSLLTYCEPNQLKQVFINILKNAIESMDNGGTITISSEEYQDDYIKVTITDEGCGISESKLKKLGEPFYTTKERGTGLGLMVSYKIIEEHKGKIEVNSKVGIGTTFSIYFPRYKNIDYN